MSISLQRFPEHRLELYIYSGVVTVDEMLEHFPRLDAAASWLSYFDSTSDLSGVELSDLPALKRAIIAKEDERKGCLGRRHALVNIPRGNEAFVRFWRSYASAGLPHAHERDLFPTLETACHWLGLPRAGFEAVSAACAADERAASRAPSETVASRAGRG